MSAPKVPGAGCRISRRLAPGPILVVILLVTATVLLVSAVHPATRQTLTPPHAPDSSLPGPLTPTDPIARSTPERLDIPSIGLSEPLDQIGLATDGTVDPPATFDHPSWFQPGPAPGQSGSAVILGHVDSYTGPAVFFRLGEVRAGDAVDVTLADGVISHFVVVRTETVAKERFPNATVYGSHGDSELQLVTCGGAFDRQQRSYLSNVIVYTEFRFSLPA